MDLHMSDVEGFGIDVQWKMVQEMSIEGRYTGTVIILLREVDR